jgi:hypothetical protein
MVKYFLIGIVSFAFIINGVARAHDIVQMDSVNKLILGNYDKLDSVFRDCELHYAMIKLEIDENNKVQEVSALNPISDAFLNLFKPLKSMTFQHEKNAKKTLVFIYVVYPRRACRIEEGEVDNKTTLHSFLPELASLLVKQIKLNPKTIYYEAITYTYPEYFEVRPWKKAAEDSNH